MAQTGGPLHTGGQPLPLRCSGQQPWPSEPLPDVLHGATREGCAIARTNTLEGFVEGALRVAVSQHDVGLQLFVDLREAALDGVGPRRVLWDVQQLRPDGLDLCLQLVQLVSP